MPATSHHLQNDARGSHFRLPLLPTLVLLVLLPAFLALGFWQLSRLHWKEQLLANLSTRPALPVAEIGTGPIPPDYQFRRVSITLDCPAQTPDARSGRNTDQIPGFAYTVTCHSGSGEVILVLGWGEWPDGYRAARALPVGETHATGLLSGDGAPYTLYPESALPPLKTVAPPDVADIPNNHLFYAIQWFSFAVILIVGYGVYVRRLRRDMQLARPAHHS